MALLLPSYPPDLLNTNWQKKKGTIAKIATSGDGTGLGKKLEALKTAFDKVKWDNMQVGTALAGISKADLDQSHVKQYIEICNKEIAKTMDARKLASEINKEAKSLAESWGKSKLIPKTSTQAASNVADKANTFGYAINPNTLGDYVKQEVNAINAEIAKQKANAVQAVAKIKPLVNNIISKSPGVKAPEEWSSFWSENVRGLGATLPYVIHVTPALKPHKAAFTKISADQTQVKDVKALEIRKKEVVDMAKILKANLA